MDCPKIFMEKQDHDSDNPVAFAAFWTLIFLSQPRFNTRNSVVSHWGKK